MTLRKAYIKLGLAILLEIFSTTMLVSSEGFTRIVPSFLAIVGYGACYYVLTYVFRSMHLGVAYAIWSGVGIVAINIIDMVIFGTPISGNRLTGMWFIVAGVIIVNFSAKYKVMEKI